jgi:hypothetical protein
MADAYADFAKTPNSCADHGLVVTPSDVADLPFISNGLYIIGAGSVRVTTRTGDVISLPALPDGTIGWYWPFYVSRVWATGTTATAIVAVTA